MRRWPVLLGASRQRGGSDFALSQWIATVVYFRRIDPGDRESQRRLVKRDVAKLLACSHSTLVRTGGQVDVQIRAIIGGKAGQDDLAVRDLGPSGDAPSSE